MLPVPYTGTAPIFVSANEPPKRRQHGVVNGSETEQLRGRFKCVIFEHNVASLVAEKTARAPAEFRTPKGELRACARCFARLVAPEPCAASASLVAAGAAPVGGSTGYVEGGSV